MGGGHELVAEEILRLGVAVLSLGAMASRTEAACTPVVQGERRPLAVISDLHMAFGRADGGDWDAFEDFRWPRALEGLLQQIANWGGDHTDLVIAGDMLEPGNHVTLAFAIVPTRISAAPSTRWLRSPRT